MHAPVLFNETELYPALNYEMESPESTSSSRNIKYQTLLYDKDPIKLAIVPTLMYTEIIPWTKIIEERNTPKENYDRKRNNFNSRRRMYFATNTQDFK